MIRSKDGVSFLTDTSEASGEDETLLFTLDQKGDRYYVEPVNSNPPNDRLWLVIRSLKDGYKI